MQKTSALKLVSATVYQFFYDRSGGEEVDY